MIKNNLDEEEKELLSLASSQAEAVISALGFRYRKSGIWITASCEVHGGDNKHGFGYNLKKNYWKCFTHHCDEEYGSSIIGLVMGVLKCPQHAAIDWLYYNLTDSNEIKKNDIIIDLDDRIYPEYCLKKLLKTNYYLEKGFRQSTVDAFEHGLAESNKMRGRVVFPIRDDNGFIRGFSGRWVGRQEKLNGKTICFNKNGKEVPKWLHTSFKKGNYLYNFNSAKKYCQEELILVESIGNVMRFYDAGFKNCVACLGTSFSASQCSLVTNSTKRVVLAFDNDKAGTKFCKKVIKRIEQYINYRVIFPPTNKDWADITNEELVKIYERN